MDVIEIPRPKRKRLIKQMHLFVEAKPLSRPRVISLGGTSQAYTPMDNQAEMMSSMCAYERLLLNLPVIVDSYFFYPQFREDRFPTSKKFGDLDNLTKAVNDNLVRAEILTDDRLIVGGESYKCFGKEPLTIVYLWEADVPA